MQAWMPYSRLVAGLGMDGFQVLVDLLAVGLRVGFAGLACESVACCSRGSRAARSVPLPSATSRLKTLVHYVSPWLVLPVGSAAGYASNEVRGCGG